MMTPMLFSVSYAGLWGQDRLDVVDFIAKAAKLGYPSVELMGKRPHLSPLDVSPELVARLKDAAKKHKVKIACLAAYNDFTAPVAGEVPAVEQQLLYIRELCRLARSLGAGMVRVFTGYYTSPTAWRADWDKSVSAVREAAGIAADFGVTLGLQNHHDVGCEFRSFQAFLQDVDHPNCKAMFDPWSPALQGTDLYECAREMAPLMVQTTLADYQRFKRFAYQPGLTNYATQGEMVRAVPLGNGFIDLPSFFRGLKEGGFSGYVCYEMCSPLRGGGGMANLDKTASKSLAKIRKLIHD